MKIEKTHIQEVRSAFEKMQSREDFLNLLNQVKPLVYGVKTVPIELKQLTWYANPNLGGKRYTDFSIKKKSGGKRLIHAPVSGLKSIQKALSFILQCVFEPHKAATGFVIGRSIVDNARIHQGCNYVFNIDMKDFFPSISQARVWACLQMEPFNLNNKRSVALPEFSDKYFMVKSRTMAGRQQIANMIAAICCTEMTVERQNEKDEWVQVKQNVLPQGAPASPVITNIVCKKLDHRLTGVANRYGLRYSRYADDITFSSMHNVYQKDGEFLKELHRIITDQGFHINEKKTRLQKTGHRQEVTGLVVNEKVNVQKRYIKQLRMWLYYWERYGYDKAERIFLEQYMDDRGHLLDGGKPNMINVLTGKLDYLRMIKGKDGFTYPNLKKRFDVLLTISLESDDMDIVLETLVHKGLNEGIRLYKELNKQ